MSFFFNAPRAEAKAKPPRKVRVQDIPVSSLQQLGCSVCPRDKDASKLRSPKMEPSGPSSAAIYLLGSAPSEEEDEDNNHWTDKAGTAIYEAFGASFMKKHVRSNFITQCRGDQTQIEVECCRPRIIADIEACRPQVVVTIGDAPLAWAVGVSGGAMTNRGALFATRIGKHVCWAYSILYPNFVHKKRAYGKSEYELAMEHDIERIKRRVGELGTPRVYDAPYDTGIEIITGEAGEDFRRLEDALNKLARLPRSTLDLETTALRPYMAEDSRILTAAVGSYEHTVAFPIMHEDGWGSDRRRRDVRGLFMEYLLQSGRKGAHNLAFELEWLEHEFGPSILRRTEWDDTQAMVHTLDERPGTQGLDYQCRKRFGFFLKAQSRVDVKRQNWWKEFPLRDILRYNGMDTKWADLLRDDVMPEITADPKFLAEYERKVRLAPTLVATETVGLVVDFDYAKKQRAHLAQQIVEVEKNLKKLPEIRKYEQRFGTFEPTAPDQVLQLYKTVVPQDAVRVEERSGAVRWTTEEDALAKIDLPSAKMILEHRTASKLLGTYVEPVLARRIVCRDGRIRCKYGQMVAVTGRLNSEDPNLQNFPKRKHKEIRGMIVPARDWLVPCDYAQIEFRVIGMASEDKNLIKYAWTDYDVHGFWAQRFVDEYPKIKDYIVQAFEVDWDEKGMKTLRQEAKNGWVFPQFFGSAARSCAQQLHIPEDIADDLAKEFWDEFEGVKKWQKNLLQSYERNLYVETLGGRKRRGPMSLNQIINHPIQGTALDIVTAGMNALSERADAEQDPELQPVLNVHDDLTFDLWDTSLEAKLPIIAHEMCLPRFDYINVPLIIEVSVGQRWHEVEEIAKYRSDKLFGLHNPYA